MTEEWRNDYNLESVTSNVALSRRCEQNSGLSLENLHPAGRQTVAGMLAKGWIAREVDARSGARYCITPAGEAALKAQLPPDRRQTKHP